MVKNVKVMYIIDLRSHVITKCGTVNDEILGILQNNSLYQTISWELHVEFRIEKHYLKKTFPSIFNFVPRVTYVLLRAADWLTTNFLGMYCYFSV